MIREEMLHMYDRAWRAEQPTPEELDFQRGSSPGWDGMISIVIPVYNTEPAFLRELADSLIAQTYQNWEACLYDGGSNRIETIRLLDKLAVEDAHLRVQHSDQNLGISGNSNEAAAMARGEWLALCDHDDTLSPEALWFVAKTIAETNQELIYSDEDKITQDGRYHIAPHYKPDYCPDNLRSGNYICHLSVMHRDLFIRTGGFRSEFDGSQDHDLLLRCCAMTQRIQHIPRTLYHWRTVASSMSHQKLEICLNASAKAVQDQMRRIGLSGTASVTQGVIRLDYDTPKNPVIGLIITESGDPEVQRRFTRSIEKLVPDWKIEPVIVSPWRASAEDFPVKARWIEWDARESWYAAINRAAALCEAEYLVFLHGSVLMDGSDWLRELIMYSQRDDIGFVTPMLYYRGRIVHGGYAIRSDGNVYCRGLGIPKKAGGWHGIMRTSHNVTAISPACAMIRRDHWQPFSDAYTGGYGMIDACLRMGHNGLRHVYTPWAMGKCADQNVRKWLLLERNGREEDHAQFIREWPIIDADPCYSERFRAGDASYRTE